MSSPIRFPSTTVTTPPKTVDATHQNTQGQQPLVNNPPPQQNLFQDVFETGTAAQSLVLNPVLPQQPAAQAQGLSETDRAAAQTAIDDANAMGGMANAQPIIDFLAAHPSPQAQAEFMQMIKDRGSPENALIMETFDRVTDPQSQAVLAGAMSAAFNAGTLRPEDLTRDGLLTAGLAVGSHENLGAIIAQSGNPQLIEAFVAGEMDILRNNEGNLDNRAAAVATALSGLPPDQLNAWLQANPESVNLVLENINEPRLSFDSSGNDVTEENSPALKKLMDTVTRIQPPTAESIGFFSSAVSQLGNNAQSREAAANFFIQHRDVLLSQGPLGFVGPNGALHPDKQGVMAQLFSQTLFSEPAPANLQAFRDSVTQSMATMQQELNALGDQEPTTAQIETARTLGSLVGALESGFHVAVDRLNAENEAIDGSVDFFKDLAGLLPDLPFPGGGFIQGQVTDRIADWLKDSLHHNPEDPSQAIPFHVLFGATLTNGAIATAYDSARGEAFMNAQNGLD